MVFTMARGRLRPSLRPSPRSRLIPTSCTDMDSDTMEDTMADSDTTARGLLMLRPIPTFFTADTMAMDSDSCTARGLLMLRLSLILSTGTVTDLDTPDTSDMPDSDTDSDTADS